MVEHSTENAGVAGSIPALGARVACNSPSGSSSAVEHFLAKEEVAGSNPVSRPTHRRLHSRRCRGVAQLVARVVRDDEVAGSSPVTPTTIHPAKRIRTRPPPHFALHRHSLCPHHSRTHARHSPSHPRHSRSSSRHSREVGNLAACAPYRPPHPLRTSSLRLRDSDYSTVFVHRSLGTTAPTRRSASAVSVCLRSAASSCDVRPYLFFALTSAPALMSDKTVST